MGLICTICLLLVSGAGSHPFLFLTEDFVREHSPAAAGVAPMFDRSVEKCISLADSAIGTGTYVPYPKEATGEGTSALFRFHQEALKAASTAWQMTGGIKYLYYYEGSFYAGYALIPALLYAQCLDRVMPELDIFHRNGGALLKSASAVFGLSCAGSFFKMNDSCRRDFSMSDYLYAVDIIYGMDPSQKWLLDIAHRWQGEVLLCPAGYRVAEDIAEGEEEKFTLNSSIIRDGPDGSSGAVMVLRSSGTEDADVVTMKACGQGGYHGHFDRLGITYFAEGEEVLTDYGYAHYPGLSLKNNGMYTPMNRSYAMTTVAHNTLIVDGKSQFEGVTPYALPHSSGVLGFDGFCTDVQYMGAIDSTAYPGVRFERWTALVSLPSLEKPFVADVIIAESDSIHDYDLPFHHQGQMMRLSVPYQYSAAADSDTEVMLLRAGANDPDFILDRHPVLMLREKGILPVPKNGSLWGRGA